MTARLVGLDVARCLALLGMVATHVLDTFDDDGGLATAQWLAGGRASALFAVLAGVSLALMTGREEPVTGRERGARSAGLAVRALLVAAVGLALGELDSGLAVILTYYGLLFLAGLLFVGLRSRALLALAGVWLVVAPVVSHIVRPGLPPRGYDSPTFGQLAQPAQLLGELSFTGYYPVVPWLTYLLVGMAIGRLDLARRSVQLGSAAAGLVVAVLATVASSALVSRPGTVAALAADLGLRPATEDALHQRIDGGMFGATPTGGDWEWLLVVAPHSATPFDLAHTAGSALLVIGACLFVIGLLPTLPQRAVAVLFGAGTMTLTLYSLHVVLRTPDFWPSDEAGAFFEHVFVLLAIGAVFVALQRRGPLEQVTGAASDRAARLVRRR